MGEQECGESELLKCVSIRGTRRKRDKGVKNHSMKRGGWQEKVYCWR